MEISNFSSLLELGAGLNIAFVAVEYSKGYTQTLANKVFKFQDVIGNSFRECHEILCDKETLNNMNPITIEGKSTLSEIEKSKREFEILEGEIQEEEKALKENIYTLCESKSFSSLSLWGFFFCVVSLFLSGIDSAHYSNCIFFCLSFFTLLFIVIGWIRGENQSKIFKYFDYSLLRHTVVVFIVCLSVSVLITCYLTCKQESWIEIANSTKEWSIPLLVLIPFANFIAFFYLIRKKATEIKQQITEKAVENKRKCDNLRGNVNILEGANNLNNKLITTE